MRHLKQSLGHFLFGVAVLLLGAAMAQAEAIKEKVSFRAETLIAAGAMVNGDLTIPDGANGKVPAVIVIHSAGGFEDPTRAPYVAALNQAGIATLELNLFAGGGRPKTSSLNLPQVYGGLIHLANDARIDPARIGITGYSTGGLLAMFTASSQLTHDFTGGKYRFAAHLPIYPVCWAHLDSIEGRNPVYKQNTYQELTGSPVHILAGAKDNYDDPDTCQKFIQALPEAARQHVGLTIYPDAGHGWDTKTDHSYYDKAANKGRGAYVNHYRNSDAAAKSLAFTVEFFKTSFGMK